MMSFRGHIAHAVLLWACLSCGKGEQERAEPVVQSSAEPARELATIAIVVDGEVVRRAELSSEETLVFDVLSAEERERLLRLTVADSLRSLSVVAGPDSPRLRATLVAEASGSIRASVYSPDAPATAAPRFQLEGVTKIEVETKKAAADPLPIRDRGQVFKAEFSQLDGLPIVNWRGNRKPRAGAKAYKLSDMLARVKPGRPIEKVTIVTPDGRRILTSDELEAQLIAIKATTTDWKAKAFSDSGNVLWTARNVISIELERVDSQ